MRSKLIIRGYVWGLGGCPRLMVSIDDEAHLYLLLLDGTQERTCGEQLMTSVDGVLFKKDVRKRRREDNSVNLRLG